MPRTYHEWDRFLTRPKIELHAGTAGAGVAGKRVLITGAGGSIGSALALACSQMRVASLVLLDNSERAIYELETELQGVRSADAVSLVVGDVCDEPLVREVFEEYRPLVVFHAAGCKHVPLMEANPFSAARTNVLGTYLVVTAAVRQGAEQFVLLSTDKVVEPVSVMGATKRVAELIVSSSSGRTQMNVVRLGNILGSSGSVGLVFLEQIAAGGPVVVSSAEATRIFYTVDEAVSLLLAAAGFASAGILIPAEGTAQRVVDLARFLVESESAATTARAQIAFGELRPGDKLEERMTSVDEVVVESGDCLVRLNEPAISEQVLGSALGDIFEALETRDLGALLRGIGAVVPAYEPEAALLARAEKTVQEMA